MSKEQAAQLRNRIYPTPVLTGKRHPNVHERMNLVKACVDTKLPILCAAQVVGKEPVSPKDKNWRGRALEAYLGGLSTSNPSRDFEDGELKSTRVLGCPNKWRIEQTLRITTLSHSTGAHLAAFEETPFYKKVSCFTCVLFDSVKGDINSGHFVGGFLFNILDDQTFKPEIKADYDFYIRLTDRSDRVSSKCKSPNGFLGCRQTGGIAGGKSATSLYITQKAFNKLLVFYRVNG